jgi:hypothetical protein
MVRTATMPAANHLFEVNMSNPVYLPPADAVKVGIIKCSSCHYYVRG